MDTSGFIPVRANVGFSINRTRRAAGVSVTGFLQIARTSSVTIAVTIVGFVAYCLIELIYGRRIHGTVATAIEPDAPSESNRQG